MRSVDVRDTLLNYIDENNKLVILDTAIMDGMISMVYVYREMKAACHCEKQIERLFNHLNPTFH